MTAALTVDDGPGNDRVVVGGDGETLFRNGDGDDDFSANGDCLFLAGPGNDNFEAGAGFQTVSYAAETRPVHVDLTIRADGTAAPGGVAGEADTIDSFIDRVEGGSGDDVILGSQWTSEIAGGAGNDTLAAPVLGRGSYWGSVMKLVGGPGADHLVAGSMTTTLSGGDGPDVLQGGDTDDVLDGGPDQLFGGADTIDCGPGRDRVRADRDDRLRNCEIVQRN